MKMHSQSRFWLALFILGGVCIIFGCQTKVKISKTPPPSVQQLAVPGGEVLENLPTAGLLPSELKGQEIFKANCATCHGIDGRGNGNPHRDLTNVSVMRKKKLFEMFDKVSNGAAHTGIAHRISVLGRWSALMYMRTFTANPPIKDVVFEQKFGRNCATCHGKRGYGDGPLSKNLVPKPANFASLERMFQRSDEEIFEIISKGAYPSAMPPWQDVSDMTDPAERWKFVDFVRSFSYKPAKIELEEK